MARNRTLIAARPRQRLGGATGLDRRLARADLLELLALLVGPLPGTPVPAVLRDPSPDAGLFGPRSVTWRLARDPLLLLGGGRALLMQVAHPLVGQGVVDHSDFAARPFGRLLGTVNWLVRVIFGTRAEARDASYHVQRMHERVRGSLQAGNATASFPTGSSYAATDPVLGRWVLATIVESMLVACAALRGALSTAEEDRLVQEWAPAGALMGVEQAALWDSAEALHGYIRAEIESGRVMPVHAAALVAPTVLRPPMPWPGLQPAAAAMGFFTTGLLPPRLRRGYGLRWSARDQALFATGCALMRTSHPFLPRKLRISPLYDIALRRTQNRAAIP